MRKINNLLFFLMLINAMFCICCDSESSNDAMNSYTTGITKLLATPGNESIVLTWKDPTSDFDHIEISESDSLGIWENIKSKAHEQGPIIVAAGIQTCAILNLVNGDEYTYTAQSIDAEGYVTSEAYISATPVIPGAPANTIYIYTHTDLDNLRNDLAGYYILMRNIDLSTYSDGEGWEPLGTSRNPFSGTFDGNYHTITGCTISRSINYQGLFGNIDTAGRIMNLGVYNTSISGYYYVGALAGYNGGTINYCYSFGTVTGTSDIGGLAGRNNGTVNNSFSFSSVINGENAGGLVGQNLGSISNSYSTGTVSGVSNLGGFAGYNSGSVINCYYNKETSGQLDNTGKGEPKTTLEMKSLTTYTTWDFTDETENGNNDYWSIDLDQVINAGYPYLTGMPLYH